MTNAITEKHCRFSLFDKLGNGSISIEPFIYRLVCTNGLALPDRKVRKNHAGRATESAELYAYDTMQAIDNAFKLKIRDLIRNAISITTFREAVADRNLIMGKTFTI